MPETTTTKRLHLQMEYNGKRLGDPDCWEWEDSAYTRHGVSSLAQNRNEVIADFKRFVAQQGESKFIRGWRIVERTTVTSDEIVEVIDNG